MTGDACPIPKNSEAFILGELVGSGSFANVYKAVDKMTKRNIAIKSYRMKKRDLGHFSRAASEMAFLRFLNHPNIISYVLSDIKKQYMYLGIEYSPHGSLINFMENKVGLTELTVRGVMKQLLSAIIYLHSMFIFHGDVKPENIIVTDIKETLIIKLSDFGLADVTMKSQVIQKRAGSFFYMAPEVHLGFPSDHTSDLYSAGVLMYEMLFGQKPFPTHTTQDQYITMLRKRAEVVVSQFLCVDFTVSPVLKQLFLTHNCLNLVKNLLSYDKQNRLSGRDLAKHPFLNIEPIEDKEPHYMKACECLLKGVDLVNHLEYGSGYIDIIEAILHLKIHINRIEGDDGLYRYAMLKLHDYLSYCGKIEERLISDRHAGRIMMQTQNEKLSITGSIDQAPKHNVSLKSTPTLLSGYDMCNVGEMYRIQGVRDHGTHLIRQGLDVIFPLMINEPDGLRKHLLAIKVNQWVKMLETAQTSAVRTTN
ncbi:hypothetical protein NQ314_016302 [Rhamnusium bicolor]|uniref:Protein kinase domain-containing protein n=1 Tax=Rhamnusium bicolor TaxID=1586634 RepID=A0AAV8WXF7_9CUCU|nr:hypothetical protein NQ314_016302 [Rhamnusium bicolor]